MQFRATAHQRANLAPASILSCVVLFIAMASPASAAQLDIPGPTGSSAFGTSVTVLPNGNIVVTDPHASANGAANVGAVYLYTSDGQLISTLTGSAESDEIGDGGVTVLENGNFLVVSRLWNSSFGAVTWMNAVTGIDGEVSEQNSLVGLQTWLGSFPATVIPLTNGNYVVASSAFSGGGASYNGAVTWGDGNSGTSGVISSDNSLIGAMSGDRLGVAVTALTNGNYVAISYWDGIGSATWVDGTKPTSGAVSPSNSLVGSFPNDRVGTCEAPFCQGVTTLSNGDYVIASPSWNGGRGAATWGSGTSGVAGTISETNSLVGTAANDGVGRPAALCAGKYVVVSPEWSNGSALHVGAITLVDSSAARVGVVSASNSLVGTSSGDQLGGAISAVTLLSNCNYVIDSPYWSDGANASVGAVTWVSSGAALVGHVTSGNSLVGSIAGDSVGSASGASPVVALSNGNYIVSSESWQSPVNNRIGAVTWADGSTGLVGTVSPANSLVGSTDGDLQLGHVSALSNGNYVVDSPYWDHVAGPNETSYAGAVTWGNGTIGSNGAITENNSLVGIIRISPDTVGSGGIGPLANGNYVVSSPAWHNGDAAAAGAVTWGRGTTGAIGGVTAANSFHGLQQGDNVGGGGVRPYADGNYVISSQFWNNSHGAITLADGRFRLKGTVQPWNSVTGGISNPGNGMTHAYDAVRHRLVVGRPGENIVSLFTMDQVFAEDFDP